MVQKSLLITSLLLTYGCCTFAQNQRAIKGTYEPYKKFTILADHSLQFTKDGKILVAVSYANAIGHNTKNQVLDIKTGYAVTVSDDAKAELLKDAIPDEIFIHQPTIYVTNARGFQRMFSCNEAIGGKSIVTIGENPDVRAIARSSDKKYIAIGYKNSVVELYVLRAKANESRL
jgi:hypothetical protein